MLTASYPHRPKNLTTLRLFVPSEMVSEALNAGPWVSWQEKSDHGIQIYRHDDFYDGLHWISMETYTSMHM